MFIDYAVGKITFKSLISFLSSAQERQSLGEATCSEDCLTRVSPVKPKQNKTMIIRYVIMSEI